MTDHEQEPDERRPEPDERRPEPDAPDPSGAYANTPRPDGQAPEGGRPADETVPHE